MSDYTATDDDQDLLLSRIFDNASALLDTVKVLLGRALAIESPSADELIKAKALVEEIEGKPFVVQQRA